LATAPRNFFQDGVTDSYTTVAMNFELGFSAAQDDDMFGR
jgi:hypothetical protein